MLRILPRVRVLELLGEHVNVARPVERLIHLQVPADLWCHNYWRTQSYLVLQLLILVLRVGWLIYLSVLMRTILLLLLANDMLNAGWFDDETIVVVIDRVFCADETALAVPFTDIVDVRPNALIDIFKFLPVVGCGIGALLELILIVTVARVASQDLRRIKLVLHLLRTIVIEHVLVGSPIDLEFLGSVAKIML